MSIVNDGKVAKILKVLGLALVYFLAAKWGLTLAFVQANATAVWPPTGIALAVLLIGGARLWPGIFLGAFLANLFTAGNVLTSMGIAAGNSLEALVGFALVSRFAKGPEALRRTQDVLKFGLLGGLAAPLVSATIGVGTLALAGMTAPHQFKDVWITWWLGDMGGALVFAPPILLWNREQWRPGKLKPFQVLEGLGFALTTGFVAWVLFGGWSFLSIHNYPVHFLLIPPLLWGAVRFGSFSVSVVLLFLSVVSILGTLSGLGPFHASTENESLVLLQSYMGVISLALLAMSAGVEEQKRAEEDLRWSHSDLQRRVLERTEDLTRSNIELERQIREKGELARGLQESNEKFHLLSEATREGVVLSVSRVIVQANSTFCRIFGYDLKEVLGMEADRFVTPEFRETVKRHITDRHEKTYTAKGLRKDGTVIDLEITGKNIQMEGITARVTAIRDVTERNRQEKERLQLALLVETSADFICTAGVDGHMQYVNGAGRRLVGLSLEENITSKLHQDFIAPQDIPRLMDEVIGSLLSKDHWEGEFNLRHFQTGAMIPMHFTAALIRDPDTNEPLVMAAIGRDTTELMKIDELSRSNKELEQFAYVASHDLQEPLRMVASFTQLLARKYKGNLDAEADTYVHQIVDGVKRMQDLIFDLLAYSRVGSDKQPFGAVDCAEVLRQALSNMGDSLKENGVKVAQGSLPKVSGDHDQLVQLFQNLISNAVKFKGSRPPEIEVGSYRKDGDWVFSVKDNGIGIDPKYFDQIFEIFKRLHTRSEYPGTGIGLAICKKVVTRHGGHIWVESQPGKGSSFFWTMPVVKGGES